MRPERDFALVLDECLDALQRGINPETILKQYPDKAERLSPLLKTAASVARTPNPSPPKGTEIASKARLMRVLAEQKADSQRQKKLVMDELGTGFRQKHGKGIVVFICSLALVFILMSSICATAAESLPGSPLYPVKLAMQEFHLMLIFDPEKRHGQQDFFYWVRKQDLLAAVEQGRIPQADAQGTLTAMPTKMNKH